MAPSFLNDTAEVVTTDVMASNGVIHVIDSVITPLTDPTFSPPTSRWGPRTHPLLT